MNNNDYYYLTGMDGLAPANQLVDTTDYDKRSVSHTSDVKTHQKGVSAILHKEIARGAVKIIWAKVKLGASNLEDSANQVYYTAISSIFSRKEKELKEEVKKMNFIRSEISNNKGKVNHLAVEIVEVSPQEQIQGKYTVKVERASGDFEKELLKPKTTIRERVNLGRDLLDGLANLHSLNYVHGDIKPENCLIYKKQGKSILKISDFGKTEKIKKAALYKGTMRFAPPEGTLNKKGDVYGAALVLIRNFEEKYLHQANIKSLKTVDKKEFDTAASENFRGIEKYVIEHKDCRVASNEGMSLDILKRRIAMALNFNKNEEAHSSAVHAYIDELYEKLKTDKSFTKKQARLFCSLLKKMTVADPKKRISSTKALARYERIFAKKIRSH